MVGEFSVYKNPTNTDTCEDKAVFIKQIIIVVIKKRFSLLEIAFYN